MVFITPFVGAIALLSGFATALPRPDSSINEPAVSAPNGTPITASYYPSETMASDASSGSDSSMDSYGSSDSSNYGSSYSPSSSDSSSYGSSYTPSSSDSSSYGSSYSPSSSDSYSGSSDSYGSSDSSSSNYGSSGSYGSSYSSASYDNSYNTMTDLATSTSTSSAWMSYSTPSYGSGMSNWGNSGYNDCVQQCVASYGALSATGTYTPSPTMDSSDSYGSSGSGVTHTVIVAPTQGVLRYVPFVVNASVGDTVQFMWGANEHTVTKSSELTPCNKTSDALFESGEQNKGFTFTQVVNDTNPTFFYCGTPTHCQKGMFGIINPPNALGSPMSVSGMMQSIAANDSDTAAYVTYTASQTSSNPDAAKWGGNIDLTNLPEWSHPLVVQNVLYARNFIAANAETLQDDGSIDLSAAGSTPLMIPQDLSAVLAASSATPAASTAPAVATPAAATPSPAASAPAANAESAKSGAMSVSSPKVVVGLVAAFATFLML